MSNRMIQSSYAGPQVEKCLGQPGCGSILGVFHHGWYLDCGGQVLLLHNTGYGRVPFGIGVDGFEACIPYRKELEGSEIQWENGVLTIPCADRSITLSPADEPPLRPFDSGVLYEMVPMAERLLEQEGSGYLRTLLPFANEIVRGQNPSLSGDLYLSRSGEALAAFFRAMAEGEAVLEEALRKMVGFGTGLTPSLDDWLVGFLYVLLRQRELSQTAALCRLVSRLSENRTNRISAVYLTAAAEGLYFESLQRAGEACSGENLRPLMEVGSSSGSDMLTGMLFAACYLKHRIGA